MIRIAAGALAGGALVATLSAQPPPQALSRTDGDVMERKLSAITDRANVAAGKPAPALKTTFTDRELNAYLAYNGQSRLPVGLREPRVTVPASNRFDGHALVDLDEVRKSKDYGVLGLFLQGTHEIKLSGTFEANNGKGVVRISSASLDGMAVPESLVELLVNHFSKTPDMPGGFQLDKPFDLPSHIKSLQLLTGSVTIVQ